ncbi:hypothetical protein N8J89_08000 [Crossiella sp. CA-258035]|uniref:deoxynucleotide monophosphate kinase family protein n=1 Tax=Crossiella sp. CA-258035 TaxID=2981138 RepID=UPI0024BBF73D|nr:hypothetical protein [Crossiella sp. CA-258035]WHT20997.1 hypothetical protein N8J89_08000 [Crossiella sp. CA-258035]
MIVGISGYAQSGKDTAAVVLAPYGWRRVAFADALKSVAFECNPWLMYGRTGRDPFQFRLAGVVGGCGWDEAKTRYPEVREFLQRLGVAAREYIHPDVWVNAALDKASEADNVIVTDVRFINEFDAIKARGGRVIRVHRPGVGPANAHVSETGLDGAVFDAHVLNDGDLGLYRSRLLDVIGEVRHAA